MSIYPDKNGFYGEFGGAFIPEMLYNNINELEENYLNIINNKDFQNKFYDLLKNYVGRPTPLYFAKNLSKIYNSKIYLKREDLCHTGSHKINNAIGQILLAKQLGKEEIIAETGAGQHGVATATVCALMKMKCKVFMGQVDMNRQVHNVARMKMLGAEVIKVESGSKTLKDATNEALRYWIANNKSTHYLIGSVVGPHPFPDIVARFQAIISSEIQKQLIEHESKSNPDYIIACVGGGSNAIGAFFDFINTDSNLIAVEAAGDGINSGKTAATISVGSKGIIHGSKTILMQTDDGQIIEPHSISAGLDYPGIGPVHAYLNSVNSVKYMSVTDLEAVNAGKILTKVEGIIPALESAHALAALKKINFKPNDIVVVNLSGRGDKDLETYLKFIYNE